MNSISLSQFITLAKSAPSSECRFGVTRNGELVLENEVTLLEESEREVNQRTWEVFKQALIEYTKRDEERLNRIYNRYKIYEEKIEQNARLKVRHIEKFGVGLADLHTCDLKWHMEKPCKLKYLKPEEIHALSKKANPNPYIGQRRSPYELRGGAENLHDYFRYDVFGSDHRRLDLYQHTESLNKHPHAFIQRFAMGLVSFEMCVGTLIPVDLGNGNIDYYKVHRVIAKDGCYAIAVKPASGHSLLQPMIAFRPTQSSPVAFDAIHTWLANLEKNTGETGYNAAREELVNLMNDPKFCPRGKKIVFTDYSLGNSFGGYFFRDHFTKISDAIIFNGVCNGHMTVNGEEVRIADFIAEQINALPEDVYPPRLFIYWNKYDWATYSGQRHFGYGITHPKAFRQLSIFTVAEEPPNNPVEWNERHGTRALDSPNPFPREVYHNEASNKHLDNAERGPEIYKFERFRNSWVATFLYYTISIVYELLLFAFKMLGINFFRTSDEGNPYNVKPPKSPRKPTNLSQ